MSKELINKLLADGVVQDVEEVIFATVDATGQVIWLGKGNKSAGFEHIVLRHLADFAKAIGATRENLAELLEQIVTNGKVVSNSPSKIGTGFDRVYDYGGEYFTVTGIGSNGFIVTAFPDRKEEERLNERD